MNQTSANISSNDFSEIVNGGWTSEASDGTVYFLANRGGSKTGVYGFTTSGGGTLSGTFSVTQPGVASSITFISQSIWNNDRFNGSGPSGMTLNPQMINSYQIALQGAGGNANFSILDTETGHYKLAHILKTANTRTKPNVQNPTFAPSWTSINVGGSQNVTIKGIRCDSYIDGPVDFTLDNRFSAYVTKNIGTSEVPLVTIRANRVINSSSCFSELRFRRISLLSKAAAQIAIIRLYKTTVSMLTGPVNYQNIDASNSIASYDTAATGVTSLPIASEVVTVDASGFVVLNYENSEILASCQDGEQYTLTGQLTGGSGDVYVSVRMVEYLSTNR